MTFDDLPAYRWRLSGPESQLLLTGPETSDTWVLKVALVELVGRRVFRLGLTAQRRLRLFSSEVPIVRLGGSLGRTESHALRVVLDALNESPRVATFDDDAVKLASVSEKTLNKNLKIRRARLIGWNYNWSSGGYVRTDVMPLLVQKGLYAQEEQGSAFGLYRSTHWQLTDAGRTELVKLWRLLEFGREQFPVLVRSDPAKATAFLELAGSAFFLMPEVFSELTELGSRPGSTGPFSSDDQERPDPENTFARALLAAPFLDNWGDLATAYHIMSESVDSVWSSMREGSGVFIGSE